MLDSADVARIRTAFLIFPEEQKERPNSAIATHTGYRVLQFSKNYTPIRALHEWRKLRLYYATITPCWRKSQRLRGFSCCFTATGHRAGAGVPRASQALDGAIA